MSHQFLDYLGLHTQGRHQCRECVPEGMPTDAFGYTGSHNRPRPLRSIASLDLDLVTPLLTIRHGSLSAVVADFAGFLFRPEPQPLFSLVEVVDRLLPSGEGT